ncbi:hypothetical protein PCE1_003420 [Barthelona sp. PCE]
MAEHLDFTVPAPYEHTIIKNDLFFVGAHDADLEVFDIVMKTDYHSSYNSYLLRCGDRIVLIDTSKDKFFNQFVDRVNSGLKAFGAEGITDFVVLHTEMDHSGALAKMIDRYPEAKIYCSGQAHIYLEKIHNRSFANVTEIKNDCTIDIGGRSFEFYVNPLVHWPDTIQVYVREMCALFTCDVFGAHYCYPPYIPTNSVFDLSGYDDAMQYYFNAIFGPLPKATMNCIESLDRIDGQIDVCCTSHGPLLKEADFKKVKEMYREWTAHTLRPKTKDTLIVYVSAYGFTEEIAHAIGASLALQGKSVDFINLNGRGADGTAEVMGMLPEYRSLLLGSSTLLNDALPQIWDVARSLNMHVHEGLMVGTFGSFGWSQGKAQTNLSQRFEQVALNEPLHPLRVRFRASASEIEDAKEWGNQFAIALSGGEPTRFLPEVAEDYEPEVKYTKKQRWRCIICNHVEVSIGPPLSVCSVCGAQGADIWELVEDEEMGELERPFEGHIVVIGAGAAGVSSVQTIRRYNTKARVTLISGESCLPYNRINLTHALSSPDMAKGQDFFLHPAQWYEQNNINLLLSCYVEGIDSSAKKLQLTICHTECASMEGENVRVCEYDELAYDKLIIATGAKAFVPYPDVIERENVFALRTVDDFWNIYSCIKRTISKNKRKCNVTFVGGGILALEAASALAMDRSDCKVSIIERSSALLPIQLGYDTDLSNHLLSVIESHNVDVHLGTTVLDFKPEENGPITTLVLDNGAEQDVDVLLFSVGIRANVSLASSMGLETQRGIICDQYLRPFMNGIPVDDIFVAGDCAQCLDVFTAPLWGCAMMEGEVAGLNCAAHEPIKKFEGRRFPATLHAFSTEIFSVGNVKTESNTVLNRSSSQQRRKLVYDGDRLCGGVLIGENTICQTLNRAVNTGQSLAKSACLLGK